VATGVPRPFQQRGSRFAYCRAGDCGGCPANSGAYHSTAYCDSGDYGPYRCAHSDSAASAHGYRRSTTAYGYRHSAYGYCDSHSADRYGDSNARADGNCCSTHSYGDSDSGASRGCRQFGRRAGS